MQSFRYRWFQSGDGIAVAMDAIEHGEYVRKMRTVEPMTSTQFASFRKLTEGHERVAFDQDRTAAEEHERDAAAREAADEQSAEEAANR